MENPLDAPPDPRLAPLDAIPDQPEEEWLKAYA